MIIKTHNFLFFGVVIGMGLFFASCGSYKKLSYLKEAQEKEKITANFHEPKIMPNDILSITVNSTVAGAALDFNLSVLPQNSNSLSNSIVQTQTTTFSGTLQTYIVDKTGQINFPVLGSLSIGGMTIKEAQEHISSLIYPRYITEERPIVNVRFLDFKVYVLGEVLRPGIYNSINGQMTIFDALAASGDLSIYGKRDNVLLIRTDEKGNITFHRINLQNKDFIQNQDLYYLQQNDKLYVETNKAKGNNSSVGTLQSLGLSAVSILISVISMTIQLTK
jgi:polysaccharide export outer membrane protein